jgi:hypothetical protein
MVDEGGVDIRKKGNTSYQSFDPAATYQSFDPVAAFNSQNNLQVELPTAQECMKAADVLSRRTMSKKQAKIESAVKTTLGWGISASLALALKQIPEIPGVKIDAQAISERIVDRLMSSPEKSIQTVNGKNVKDTKDTDDDDVKLFLEGLSKLLEKPGFSDYILALLLINFIFMRVTGVGIQSYFTKQSFASKETSKETPKDTSNKNIEQNDVKKDADLSNKDTPSKRGRKRISRRWFEEQLNNINLKGNK